MRKFVDGSEGVHQEHGVGIIRECTDPDYVYFEAQGRTFFAYREYISQKESKNVKTSRVTTESAEFERECESYGGAENQRA